MDKLSTVPYRQAKIVPKQSVVDPALFEEDIVYTIPDPIAKGGHCQVFPGIDIKIHELCKHKIIP